MKWVVFVILAAAVVSVGVARPLLSRAGDSVTVIASPVSPVDSASIQLVTPPPATAPSATQPALSYTTLRGHEGFWRLGEDESGAWWFVSPTGTAEFLNMVTTVQPFQHGRDPKGPDYASRDCNCKDPSPENIDHWAQATLKRVTDIGFKGLGAWCHPVFHKFDVPMTRDLNTWDWIANSSKRLYSPGWSEEAEAAIKAQCELLRDNKNLIGYYTDNELDWGDDGAGPATYFDHLPVNDPNRIEVQHVIQATWPTLRQFNQDWNTKLTDWKQLETWDYLPKDQPKAYERLFTAWLSHLAGDYFRITTALVHKYDPNHLVLGVRFRGYAPPEVVRAASGLTDAQSLNYYVGDAKLDRTQFSMMYASSHQPVIISEYSFHSLDGRSGDRDDVGFSAQVPDQRARAEGYRLMTTRLARVPYVVGADWFQWMDEPPSGRSSDGEDVNFGVVDITDHPYELLVNAIKSTTPLLNPLHRQSSSDDEQDVWRDTFLPPPVAAVPYLSTPISIDGNLNDWPSSARLTNMRMSHTVGVDRNALPLPNVYLGWRDDGMYMGLEVFDSDVESAPAKAWWWTKDSVEFWFSTHAVAADQHTYDIDSHQFFYVPNDLTTGTADHGVVGQWHRPGDAIADNIIPVPSITQATRILPDRYTVEIHIPSSALHGWDPQHQKNLAFNVHVKNYQHAIDYFWSAPKETMTQFRPDTWGVLRLQPPAAARS